MNNYEKQANDFLKECGVLFFVEKAVPQQAPRWAKGGEHGTQWSIVLVIPKEAFPPDRYVGRLSEMAHVIDKQIQFFFWSSIASKEKAKHSYSGEKHPRAYDVLAGIYNPVESFEDFCANYGYEIDSRNAYATYEEVRALNAKLESIFTKDQLEKLSEIV